MKDMLENVPKKRKNFLFPVCTDRVKQRIEETGLRNLTFRVHHRSYSHDKVTDDFQAFYGIIFFLGRCRCTFNVYKYCINNLRKLDLRSKFKIF